MKIKNYGWLYILEFEHPFHNEITDKIAPQKIKSNLTLTSRIYEEILKMVSVLNTTFSICQQRNKGYLFRTFIKL